MWGGTVVSPTTQQPQTATGRLAASPTRQGVEPGSIVGAVKTFASLRRCRDLAVIAVVLATATLATTQVASAASSSRYLSITDKDCPTVDRAKHGEGDFATLRCRGSVDGWRAQIDYDDARESITLQRRSESFDLKMWTIEQSFSSLGTRLEFRLKGSTAKAAIVRYNLQDPDDVKRSQLFVIRLGSVPCVVANVNGSATQSAEARAIADSPGLAAMSCLAS